MIGNEGRPRSVALLGEDLDPDELAAMLPSGTGVERVADIQELLRSDPDVALVSIRPDELATIAAALAAHPDHPPLTILLGQAKRPHPQLGVMDAIVQAKREWEGAFDALTDPVVILDENGGVRRANLSFAEALRRPIAQTLGSHYGELLGEPLAGRTDPIASCLNDGIPQTQETQYVSLPGLRLVTTAPLPQRANSNRGLVVILKDISQLKEQQEQLFQTSRLADVGLLSAGVAHEINTPLASIGLRAESLLKHVQDPRLVAIDAFKNFPRYLETIKTEIFRCKKIIAALLEFSRSRKREVRELDVNSLAEKAGDLLGHQMKIKQVVFELKLESRLPCIQADEGQISQALIVLLMNALDATPPRGHVTLETAKEGGGTVRITVADEGTGIPPENMDRIFNPFFTTKPTGKGTGLGLAICHGVVSSHGGEIRVESEVDRGSRFSLLLPVSGPQNAEA
jgi:signal transduction histidine kinase